MMVIHNPHHHVCIMLSAWAHRGDEAGVCCIWFDTNPHSAAGSLLWYFVILLHLVILCWLTISLLWYFVELLRYSAVVFVILWCCAVLYTASDLIQTLTLLLLLWYFVISLLWYFVILLRDSSIVLVILWCFLIRYAASDLIQPWLCCWQYLCCDTLWYIWCCDIRLLNLCRNHVSCDILLLYLWY